VYLLTIQEATPIKWWFIFPLHINSVSALPCKKTQKLRTCSTFTKSVIVSVAVWKMGVDGLNFVEPGIKVTASITRMFFDCSKCYLLSHMLWVTISTFSRTAHLRIGLVTQSNFCSVKHLTLFLQSYGPATVRIWFPLLTRFGQSRSSVCMRCRSTMSTNSSSDWLMFGAVGSNVLSTLLSVCGVWRKHLARFVCSCEGRTLRTSAVGCFDNGMKLSIDSLCIMLFWNF